MEKKYKKDFTLLEISRKKVFKIRKKKFLTGFTLIELLVVIAMIAILAALLLTNYHSGQRQLALELQN